MKFFLCILSIGFVSANVPDRPGTHHFDYIICCKVEKSPALTQSIEYMTDLAEQCEQERGKPVPPKFECLRECLASKTNILNADKSLNENAYRAFIKTQMASENYQKAAVDGIATKCIEEVKKLDGIDKDVTDGCSKTGAKAFHCAGKELINSCPAEKQDTTDQCVKFREFINRKMGQRPSRAQK